MTRPLTPRDYALAALTPTFGTAAQLEHYRNKVEVAIKLAVGGVERERDEARANYEQVRDVANQVDAVGKKLVQRDRRIEELTIHSSCHCSGHMYWKEEAAKRDGRIAVLENLAWEGVTVMRGTPYRQCRICRGVDPRCTEMIAESRVTNIGHQSGCPYLVTP